MIGAGGIGCELIKNLALLKVGEIMVIDLDTIDVSNLNRQFLFRREHVGKSKAEVASAAALRLFPGMKVSYRCDNVKNFDQSFVSQFDIVMSALDNIDARRHLNRICLAASRPLVEAGSTGYIGQSRVIIKDMSECYECQPKEAPKVFPVCTIRSSPSTPVHCIQWAKMLFELLFGGDNGDSSSLIGDLHISSDSPYDYLRHIFHDDILAQCKLFDKWLERKPPVCISLVETTDWSSVPDEVSRVLTVDEYQCMFLRSVSEILKNSQVGHLSFSKDDPVSVDFVAAASNLRMHNYHIPMLSRWDIESIAGAIVPAIATTNAIVAGLECFNLSAALRGNPGRDLWVRYPHASANGSIVQSATPSVPNQNCFICQNKMISVKVSNFEKCSLLALVESVFVGYLGINDPIVIKDQTLIYDHLEDDESILQQFEENLIQWKFDKQAQPIQVEDSVTNETFHVSINEDYASDLVFHVGNDTINPAS